MTSALHLRNVWQPGTCRNVEQAPNELGCPVLEISKHKGQSADRLLGAPKVKCKERDGLQKEPFDF